MGKHLKEKWIVRCQEYFVVWLRAMLKGNWTPCPNSLPFILYSGAGWSRATLHRQFEVCVFHNLSLLSLLFLLFYWGRQHKGKVGVFIFCWRWWTSPAEKYLVVVILAKPVLTSFQLWRLLAPIFLGQCWAVYDRLRETHNSLKACESLLKS